MKLGKVNLIQNAKHAAEGNFSILLGVGGLLCSYKEQEHAPPH